MKMKVSMEKCFCCISVLCFSFALFSTVVSAKTTGPLKFKKSDYWCPCLNPDWCDPIIDTTRNEVFAFSVANDSTHWTKFDWSKVTTVVMVGYVNSRLMCMAHALNARVSYIANSNIDFTDPTARKRWIEEQVVFMQKNHLDGLNFDFEGLIAKKNSSMRDGYTRLVAETNAVLKKVLPYSQVTVDVAWKKNTDQRFYDYKGLADNSDFLFVMAYDEQSQINGECVAMPNSGLGKTLDGLSAYIDQGIPTSKLVLGLPWYGYIYPCTRVEGDHCFLKPVPFRGVPCSDAAGKQYAYDYIRKLSSTYTVQWNSTSSTPYFIYTSLDRSKIFQVQYDNPQSLALKYEMALKMKLRGVGMWTVDGLNYEDSPEGRDCRSDMFGALPTY